jgi:RNA-binding protein
MSEQVDPKLQPFEITGAQKRALRGQGHALKALLRLGQKGLTDEFVESVRMALADHELIKVSMGSDVPKARKEQAKELAQRTGSHLAQTIGKIALLYRRRIHRPEIQIPGKVLEAPQKIK